MWSHRVEDAEPWVFTSEDGREHRFSRFSAARAFASVSGTIKELTACAAEYLSADPPEAAETLLAAVRRPEKREDVL